MLIVLHQLHAASEPGDHVALLVFLGIVIGVAILAMIASDR
jgi:hypothetical protein